MKKIVLISILSLLVMLFAVFIIPSNGGVQAMDLTTTTTLDEVTTTTAVEEEEPVTTLPEIFDDPEALQIALGALIDEKLGPWIWPLGITGFALAGILLWLLGLGVKKLTQFILLAKGNEVLQTQNKTSNDNVVKAISNDLAPGILQLALEMSKANALAAVNAYGQDILIMGSNNEKVALESKEYHRMYSEALSIKDADKNIVQNITNSITNTLKKEAAKVVENTVQTLTKVKNDSLARLKAKVEQPESGV